MGDFRMPALGADMQRGKLIEWLVQPGDYVHRGDLVATVDTEKTLMDVESFEEGVVAELLVEPGATVPVGTALARITQTPAAHDVRPLPATGQAPGRPPSPAPDVPAQLKGAAPVAAPPVHAPPPVRSLAHRLGVDLATVRGTGSNGAVTRADVERSAVQRKPQPGAGAPRTVARIRSSPRARQVAAQLGVDLAAVPGTGPQGAVTEADVRRAGTAPARSGAAGAQRARPAAAAPEAAAPEAAAPEAAAPAAAAPAAAARPQPATEAAQRTAGVRRTIASLMSRSKKSIPHYYLGTTIDLQAALAWMQASNAGRPVASRLVPSALLLKASALAAREVPEVNGFYAEGRFRPSSSVHLGVAVALRQGGLIAPAIRDADTLSLDLMMERLRDLVSRARAGHLQRAEMAEPTITVTNLGDLGVESVYGVIYPPQVAMIGFGRVTEQPWAQDGMLGVRPVVVATLSADHRVSDGLRGGRFLTRVAELLQKPEEL